MLELQNESHTGHCAILTNVHTVCGKSLKLSPNNHTASKDVPTETEIYILFGVRNSDIQET